MAEEKKLIYSREDIDSEKAYYEVTMRCLNCGAYENDYYCEMGQLINMSVLKNSQCHYCECKGCLVKDFEKPVVLGSGGNSNNNNDSCLLPAAVGFAIGLGF